MELFLLPEMMKYGQRQGWSQGRQAGRRVDLYKKKKKKVIALS
jgi:hypothetical protein